MKLINIIPPQYRILIALAGIAIIFASGMYSGIRWEKYSTQKTELETQTARANNAEEDRDIANAAPDTLDAMLEWLP